MSDNATTPQHLSFHTTDVEVARDHVTQAFSEHEMHVVDDTSLDLNVDMAVGRQTAIGRMSYGAPVTISAPPMHSYYVVSLPLTGSSTARQRGQDGEARAGRAGVSLLPTDPLLLNWSPDAEQYVIKLRREQLEAHASRMIGRPVGLIEFDLNFDLTSGPTQALLATTGFVYSELSRPAGLATMPAAFYELESLLMTQVLMVVPNQLSNVLISPPEPVRRARIDEVVDLIDADPSAELSSVDLADRVGVSVRALQQEFRDVLGVSPSAYVRGVRLDRVHQELLRGGESVTDVAARWGFFHPGRFAQQYRERFGEAPSQTARSPRQA
jgi:AraC-like DNA-binding protein